MNTARKLSVTVIAEAAGDYGAADVVSNSDTGDAGVAAAFTGAAPLAGSIVTLFGVAVRVNAPSFVPQLKLHFFNRAPVAAEVEMDDNVAFSIKTTAGQDIYLGSVTLPALANPGGTLFAAAETVTTTQIQKPMQLGSGETSLYMVIETVDADSNEVPTMNLDFDLFVF